MKRKQSVSGSVERKRKIEHKDEISALLRKMEAREQEDRKKKEKKKNNNNNFFSSRSGKKLRALQFRLPFISQCHHAPISQSEGSQSHFLFYYYFFLPESLHAQ